MDNIKYLVLNYSNMRLGGIQTIMYGMACHYLEQGWNILWIAPEFYQVDQGFSDIFNKTKINILNEKDSEKFLLERSIDYILFISFDFGDYLCNYNIQVNLKCNGDCYFVVPNILGAGVKLEDDGDTYTLNKLSRIYELLVLNGSIMFCAPAQKEFFFKHYSINDIEYENSRNNMFLPSYRSLNGFDENVVRARYSKYEIITVSRFDFPDKGYILGLVDNFADLKKNYPLLQLRIIGEGYNGGDIQLKTKIMEYGKEISDSIILEGAVSHKMLSRYFNNAKLFVGVDGAVLDAVSSGLPSLVARHGITNCEVYGFYSECKKTVCRDPGQDALPYIKYVLGMSEDEYLKLSISEYNNIYNIINSKSRDLNVINKKDILTDKEVVYLEGLYRRHYNKREKINFVFRVKQLLWKLKKMTESKKF